MTDLERATSPAEALATMRSALTAIAKGFEDIDTDHVDFRVRAGAIAQDALQYCKDVTDEQPIRTGAFEISRQTAITILGEATEDVDELWPEIMDRHGLYDEKTDTWPTLQHLVAALSTPAASPPDIEQASQNLAASLREFVNAVQTGNLQTHADEILANVMRRANDALSEFDDPKGE